MLPLPEVKEGKSKHLSPTNGAARRNGEVRRCFDDEQKKKQERKEGKYLMGNGQVARKESTKGQPAVYGDVGPSKRRANVQMEYKRSGK